MAYSGATEIAKRLKSIGIARSTFKANTAYTSDTAAFAVFIGPSNMKIALDKKSEILAAGLNFHEGINLVLVSLPRQEKANAS